MFGLRRALGRSSGAPVQLPEREAVDDDSERNPEARNDGKRIHQKGRYSA